MRIDVRFASWPEHDYPPPAAIWWARRELYQLELFLVTDARDFDAATGDELLLSWDADEIASDIARSFLDERPAPPFVQLLTQPLGSDDDSLVELALDDALRRHNAWPPLARHLILARVRLRWHPQLPDRTPLQPSDTRRPIGIGLSPPHGRTSTRYAVFSSDAAQILIPDMGWAMHACVDWSGADPDHANQDHALLQSTVNICMRVYEGSNGRAYHHAISTHGEDPSAVTESAHLTSSFDAPLVTAVGITRSYLFEEPTVYVSSDVCAAIDAWPEIQEGEPPSPLPLTQGTKDPRRVLSIRCVELETPPNAAKLPRLEHIKLRPAPIILFQVSFVPCSTAPRGEWSRFSSYDLELYLVADPSIARHAAFETFDEQLVAGQPDGAHKLATVRLASVDGSVTLSLDEDLARLDIEPAACQMVFARLVLRSRPGDQLGAGHPPPVARGCARWAVFTQPGRPVLPFEEERILIPDRSDLEPMPAPLAQYRDVRVIIDAEEPRDASAEGRAGLWVGSGPVFAHVHAILAIDCSASMKDKWRDVQTQMQRFWSTIALDADSARPTNHRASIAKFGAAVKPLCVRDIAGEPPELGGCALGCTKYLPVLQWMHTQAVVAIAAGYVHLLVLLTDGAPPVKEKEPSLAAVERLDGVWMEQRARLGWVHVDCQLFTIAMARVGEVASLDGPLLKRMARPSAAHGYLYAENGTKLAGAFDRILDRVRALSVTVCKRKSPRLLDGMLRHVATPAAADDDKDAAAKKAAVRERDLDDQPRRLPNEQRVAGILLTEPALQQQHMAPEASRLQILYAFPQPCETRREYEVSFPLGPLQQKLLAGMPTNEPKAACGRFDGRFDWFTWRFTVPNGTTVHVARLKASALVRWAVGDRGPAGPYDAPVVCLNPPRPLSLMPGAAVVPGDGTPRDTPIIGGHAEEVPSQQYYSLPPSASAPSIQQVRPPHAISGQGAQMIGFIPQHLSHRGAQPRPGGAQRAQLSMGPLLRANDAPHLVLDHHLEQAVLMPDAEEQRTPWLSTWATKAVERGSRRYRYMFRPI